MCGITQQARGPPKRRTPRVGARGADTRCRGGSPAQRLKATSKLQGLQACQLLTGRYRTMIQSTIDAVKALHQGAMQVQNAPEGQRNDILNKVAYELGEYVGDGRLDRTHVENVLEDVAQAQHTSPTRSRRYPI